MTAIFASCTIYIAQLYSGKEQECKIVVLENEWVAVSIITTEKHVRNLLTLLREYHLSGFGRIN